MATTKSDIDTKCLATIEVTYPLFVIHTNHVTTLPDTSLYALCDQVYTAAVHNLSLTPLAPLLSLRAILNATFDAAHRAFVVPEASPALLATLSEDARACIFAQAVAGMLFFLRGIAAITPAAGLTAENVQARLQRFAEGADRARMLKDVEAWAGWDNCFEKAQIGGMIADVVGVEKAAAVKPVEKKVDVDVSVVTVDDFVEAPSLFNDGPHPTRELGVPDKFTFMALN